MSRDYYVYILSNEQRTVYYTGFTNDLKNRVWQHKRGAAEGFTKKYQVHDLVYYEVVENAIVARTREIKLKKMPRTEKTRLIGKFNPSRKDLYDGL